jgi:hypothetical protein
LTRMVSISCAVAVAAMSAEAQNTATNMFVFTDAFLPALRRYYAAIVFQFFAR